MGTPAPPILGISVRGIRAFLDSARLQLQLEGKTTTTQVVQQLLSKVAKPKLSYCEQEQAKSPSTHIAPATIWVSHAWGNPFLSLVNALERWERRRRQQQPSDSPPPPPAFFAIDVFSFPQHGVSEEPSSLAATSVPSLIPSLSATLVVLDWEEETEEEEKRKKVLQNPRCLSEVACAPKGSLSIALTEEEDEDKLAAYLGGLKDAPDGVMASLERFPVIDPSLLPPNHPPSQGSGIDDVRLALRIALGDLMLRTLLAFREKDLVRCDLRPIQSMFPPSPLRPALVERILRRRAAYGASAWGQESERTLGMVAELGDHLLEVLRDKASASPEEYDEARSLLEDAIRGYEIHFRHKRGRINILLNKLVTALLETFRRSTNATSSDTRTSWLNEAVEASKKMVVNACAGRGPESKELLQAEALLENALSELDSFTAPLSVDSLSYSVHVDGQELAPESAMAFLGLVFPPGYRPIVVQSSSPLPYKLEAARDLVWGHGLYPQAAAYCARLVEQGKESDGPRDPTTLFSLHLLAVSLHLDGQLDEADAKYKEVVEGRRKVFGADHPRTLVSMSNAALLQLAKGNVKAAGSLLEKCVSGLRLQCGEGDERFLLSTANLARVRLEMGRTREAEELYESVAEKTKDESSFSRPLRRLPSSLRKSGGGGKGCETETTSYHALVVEEGEIMLMKVV